jgi:type III pantothenate kinase
MWAWIFVMEVAMLLAIDVGNTNTVLGVFDDTKLLHSWRLKTDSRSTADELSLQFRGLLAGSEVTAIAICSTVPAVLREMRRMFAIYFPEINPTIVEPGTKTGVPLLVDNPKEIGADRIVNSLAAHELYGSNGAVIVVDFGTSTNLDVVSPRGEFLGGALAPGIEISVDALASRAAQLRKVELIVPRSVIGKNTVEALQSGTIYGFAGQVDRLVELIIEELGTSATVIATGGLAPLVLNISQTIEHHEPDLTLIGLRLVHAKNS